MKRVLVAVDGAKGSHACIETCARIFADRPPPTVILLHVLRYGGATGVDDMSNDAELAELREAVEGTPQMDELKAKAEPLLIATRAAFEARGFHDVQTVIKSGRPAEGILEGAAECEAELIVVGDTRGLMDKLMMGDVVEQVTKGATVPVLLAR